ncbi:MAG: hypothetical protein ACI4P4_11970, partial [Faecousia sp.]
KLQKCQILVSVLFLRKGVLFCKCTLFPVGYIVAYMAEHFHTYFRFIHHFLDIFPIGRTAAKRYTFS